MDNETLAKEIEKIKYQIKTLAETINHIEYPLQSLILSMDWDDSDLNRVHDIFEKYNKYIEIKKDFSWQQFRADLESEMSITYQSLKSVIIAFYRNGMWTELCRRYAKENASIEIDFIARDAAV